MFENTYAISTLQNNLKKLSQGRPVEPINKPEPILQLIIIRNVPISKSKAKNNQKSITIKICIRN